MRRLWLLALALSLLTGCSGSSQPETLPSPSIASTRTFTANEPVGLVAAAGKVWTVEAGGDEISGRADPTDQPVRVHVGTTPLRAAYDGQLIWVSVFGADRVAAVDPARAKVVRRVKTPGQPEGMVSAFGAIWVVRQQAGLLTRISPEGRVGPSYRLGDEPRLVVADDRYLYASNFVSGTITRVDPKSGARRTSKQLCTGPQDMVVVGTVLWVSCTPEEKVVTLDTRTLRVLGTVEVDGEPDAMRVVDSLIYVVTTDGPTLVELNGDPSHPAVVRHTPLGEAPALLDQANIDATTVNGTWWVSSPSENKVLSYSP